MTKLYKKSEVTFAILWIAAYVVLTSLADKLSESVGISKSVTAAIHIVMVLVLYFWIRKNGLSIKYGFCRSKVPAKRFLYYLPLAVIASSALWRGAALKYDACGTLLYVISMCCVGFLEEVIFRGLLFRAMEKDGLKTAIIVSAVTFGLGHIVNLFNGNGKSPAETAVQILFAVLAGFVLVLIFCYGGSLIPCILFHSVNNSLNLFSADGNMSPPTEMALNIVWIIVVLGGYLFYLVRIFPKKADYTIRMEEQTDHRAVENLIRESFWNVYRPGCSEHFVIHVLRDDPAFVKELDFVMEQDGRLIGQNMFMRTVIEADDGRTIPVLTMGPICITPELKRKGYGKALLDHSLEKAAGLGHGAVLFEGNIGFYGKSGFDYASRFGIRYHDLPEDADASFFLCRELIPGYLDSVTGVYQTPAGYYVDDADVEAFDKNFPPKQKQKLPGQIF